MKRFIPRLSTFSGLALIILAACSSPAAKPTSLFQSDLQGSAKPWTDQTFDTAQQKFSFAIISDLYSGERPGVFKVAVAQLNLLQPDFVMSVGDLVNGGTEDTLVLQHEYDDFEAKIAPLDSRFFHVGGNHDLTNGAMQNYWKGRFGATYYYFLYRNVLFLVLNSEDYSPARMQEIYQARAEAIKVLDGPHPETAAAMEYFKMPERVTGRIGPGQAAYFSKVIQDHPKVRWTFLFMHKPVWQRDDDEGLNLIEKALGNHPYTVFNGHFHSYSYHQRNHRDYLILGTTSGGQNAADSMSFDHITYVTLGNDTPSIANLRLDGILDKSGHIPYQGDTLDFQASNPYR